MKNNNYDRALDPYVDIIDEDEALPAVLPALIAVIAFFGKLFGRR